MLATVEHRHRTWSGFVSDYSEGGLYLMCDAPVSPGDQVDVWLQRPMDGAEIQLPAVVRHVAGPVGEATQRLGLQFARVLSDAVTIRRVDPVGSM